MKKVFAIIISLMICLSAVCFSACGETKEFENLTFRNRTVNYDGTAKNEKMFVSGLPEGATTAYVFVNSSNGQTVESAIEIGIYDITATVSKKGYKEATLYATLTIKVKDGDNPEPTPSQDPDLTYTEIAEKAYLYDLNGEKSIDLKNILSDKSKTELGKYASAKWYLNSVGNVKGDSLIVSSPELSVSQIKKEQYKVEVMATTKSNQTRLLFKGVVDFYDYVSDGFVWNVMDKNIENYIVSRHVIKNGVTFENGLFYEGVIEGGACLVMKDEIFDYTDEEIQEEIDRKIQQIQNDSTTPELTGITYLNCAMMVRPLHSKAYYEKFKNPASKLSFKVILYCDQPEAAEQRRNVNDYNGGSRNTDKLLNEWFKVEIRIDSLLENYDKYIQSATASCGAYTALFGLQHDQLSYTSKVEDINVLKVEVLINELEIK